MAFIDFIDGPNRKIHLDATAAVSGVLTFHPVTDLYPEYKTLRQTNEAYRQYDAFMEAQGNLPKGGGKFTPRFLMLLGGTTLVIPDGVTKVVITGEILSDTQGEVLDTSELSGPCVIEFAAPNAEIIAVNTGGGSSYTLPEIRDAVWSKTIESGFSASEVLAIMSAIMAGKTQVTRNIDGSTTIVFRNLGDTLDKVEALVEAGSRTEMTHN